MGRSHLCLNVCSICQLTKVSHTEKLSRSCSFTAIFVCQRQIKLATQLGPVEGKRHEELHAEEKAALDLGVYGIITRFFSTMLPTQYPVVGGAVRCNDPDRAGSAGLVPPIRVYLLRESSSVPLMGELRLKFRAT